MIRRLAPAQAGVGHSTVAVAVSPKQPSNSGTEIIGLELRLTFLTQPLRVKLGLYKIRLVLSQHLSHCCS